MSLDEAYYPSERRRFVKKAGNRTPERARCKTCSNAADKTIKGIPYCEGCAPVEVPVLFGQTVH
ncbi:MAG: hypothetical protein RLZZ283_758 [Candidatus Parcubacteria bacterium]|jgi:hypothetical protein